MDEARRIAGFLRKITMAQIIAFPGQTYKFIIRAAELLEAMSAELETTQKSAKDDNALK